MSLPDRRCYGKSRCLHIGTCCDFWADYGLCVCNPVDASSYPTGDRLYIAANIPGFSRPNIRTVFEDGYEEVYDFPSSYDYCYIYWDFGGWGGKVTFQLRDGSSVRNTRTTTITGAEPEPDPEPEPDRCENVNIRINLRDYWCTFSENGEMRLRANYQNTGDVAGDITMKMYVNGIVKKSSRYVIVPRASFSQSRSGLTFDGDTATVKFVALCGGEIISEVTKTAVKPIPPEPDPEPDPPFVCNDGEMRLMSVCSDGSVIYGEVCRNNTWVSSGEKCPSPDPDPDPDGTPWDMIALAGIGVVVLYLFMRR